MLEVGALRTTRVELVSGSKAATFLLENVGRSLNRQQITRPPTTAVERHKRNYVMSMLNFVFYSSQYSLLIKFNNNDYYYAAEGFLSQTGT